mmetsp:Transcript_15714/g.36719  ORF Transcript_15714/g.36719 Transcript_15714/m.36719 type:complete len:200 (-) Transcript_15714:789-1388(-)
MPLKPRRLPAAQEPSSGSAGPDMAVLRRLPTRKVCAWLGSAGSAFTRSSASTTSATMAVVSSALPLSRREAVDSSPRFSCSSGWTLRIAASTSATAVCSSCLTAGSRCSCRPSSKSASLLTGCTDASMRLAQSPDVQCFSTIRVMSSSRRLSKIPSLPRTRRSPLWQLTVFIRAPEITKCVSEDAVLAKRVTCTGLLAS